MFLPSLYQKAAYRSSPRSGMYSYLNTEAHVYSSLVNSPRFASSLSISATVIISPIHRIVSQHGGGNVSNVSNNNLSHLLSSNGDFGNNEDIKFFDTFNNSNNNYLKNGTLIDNRDKKNNNMIDNSFAENVKMSNYLKKG